MSRSLIVIVKKELKRVFTDRRLVFTTFILPALSIAIIYSLMGTMINNVFEDREEHIPSVYIQNIPNNFHEMIMNSEWNNQIQLNIVPDNQNIESLKTQIKEGNIDLLVIFDSDFIDKINNYKEMKQVPNVRTYYNSSEDYSIDIRKGLFNSMLSEYENNLLGNRLGNIEYANVFDVDRNNTEANIVDERKATGKGLGMLLPMLLGILLFAGAMGIGIDSIAGEKERGTMATMLVTPIKRHTIAFGKIISLGIVALISTASSFIGILISLPFSAAMFGGGEEVHFEALKFGPTQYIQLLILMITLVGIYVGIICLLSVTAKSVKEAGSYLAPAYMLVMVSAFLNMFSNKPPLIWQHTIPIYGNIVGIRSLLMFELTWIDLGLCCISSIITTSILILLIKKMFNSERIMFNS